MNRGLSILREPSLSVPTKRWRSSPNFASPTPGAICSIFVLRG